MGKLTVELLPMEFLLRAPLRTASGAYSQRRSVVVLVRGDGLIGAGEGAPLESFGTEGYDAMVRVLGLAKEAWERLKTPRRLRDVDTLLSAAGELDGFPAARHALEGALLDLVAQHERVPLATLLARTPHSRSVRVSALISKQDAQGAAAEARAAASAGHDTVKLKVAVGELEADVARVRAVREAVGGSCRIRIDANGGWTREQAAEALRRLADFDLELCEQPVASDELDGLRALRGATKVPIAADESLGTRRGRDALLEGGGVDVLVLKPMVLGGLRRTVELAQRASKQGMTSYVTSSLEGPVGRLAALHAAIAVGDRHHAHGLSVGSLFADSAGLTLLEPKGGALSLLGEAGLGLTW